MEFAPFDSVAAPPTGTIAPFWYLKTTDNHDAVVLVIDVKQEEFVTGVGLMVLPVGSFNNSTMAAAHTFASVLAI
jgi:hypothetical protein